MNFRELHHQDQPLIMPNPWDIGTARLYESMGFLALATTSSGHAYTIGRADGVRAVSRDEALDHAASLAAAVSVPINGDLERGYGDSPADVAETVSRAADAGLAGCSIEDSTGINDDPIYDPGLATERVAAAVEAARDSSEDFVLTARAENFLHGRRDLADTISRLQAFQDVGADVLYAPGITDLEMMAELIRSVDRPVNALARPHWTVDELAEIGVSRISVGGAMAVSAFATAMLAAQEVLAEGTFTYTNAIPDGFNLNELFLT